MYDQARINEERFTETLTAQFERLFIDDLSYIPAARSYTPAGLAVKMVREFSIGKRPSKDGAGVKATCKALGIKPTYKAIEAFLRGDAS